jgi:hypothetical protein
MEPRLAAKGVPVMVICAGKLGCRVLDRRVFAGRRVGGMHDTGAVTSTSGAGGPAATTQSSARTRTASTHVSAPARSAASSARVAARATRRGVRRAA